MKWKIIVEGKFENPINVPGAGKTSIHAKDLAENFVSTVRRAGHSVTRAAYSDDSEESTGIGNERIAMASLSLEMLAKLIGLPPSMRIIDVRVSNTSDAGPIVMMKVSDNGGNVSDNSAIVLSYKKDNDDNYKLVGMRETSW